MAVGIDFDSIAPFIFVALIVISQLMSALKKKGAKQQDEEPDVDALERARQIREEIRRKIEERRQELEPGTTRPVDRPLAKRSAYDPTRPDGQRQQPRTSQMPTRERQEVPKPSPSTRSASSAQPARTESPSHQSRLQQQLAEQRKRLEASRRQQAEAHERAKRMLRESGAGKRLLKKAPQEAPPAIVDLKKDLLSGLKGRDGLKRAILYREILDKPLGLR